MKQEIMSLARANKWLLLSALLLVGGACFTPAAHDKVRYSLIHLATLCVVIVSLKIQINTFKILAKNWAERCK